MSLDWTEAPDDSDPNAHITLIRAPAKGSLKITCLSDRAIGRGTHYFGRRTIPCIGMANGCKPCAELQIARWTGWIAAKNVKAGTLHVVEFTGDPGAQLKRQREEQGSLRGLQMEFFRTGGLVNSPVRVRTHGQHPEAYALPPAFEIIKVLERIWGMKDKLIITASGDPDDIIAAAKQEATEAAAKADRDKHYRNGKKTEAPHVR